MGGLLSVGAKVISYVFATGQHQVYMGGRRGAAAAEVLTPAIAENSTATAVAAAAAAEEEDTVADSKSGSRAGNGISDRLLISSLIS